uniref:Uncharacterized protein LOC102809062 n=1 Tax=Saccoglossus kowalevskii TaxID=10224 RepID=A0ABM0LU25_SACKO|nr:PREDICTED: uncharacterized protein LOC102809062 [Saccoglossus kowalevskii]
MAMLMEQENTAEVTQDAVLFDRQDSTTAPPLSVLSYGQEQICGSSTPPQIPSMPSVRSLHHSSTLRNNVAMLNDSRMIAFQSKLSFRLGGCQIAVGLVSIIIGCWAIMLQSYGSEIGIAIWTGVIVKFAMVWGFISVGVSILPITMGAVGISQEGYLHPDYCLEYPDADYPCSSITSRMVVDVLIMAVGVIQIGLAMPTTAIQCFVVCTCCKPSYIELNTPTDSEAVLATVSGDVHDRDQPVFDQNRPPMLVLPPSYISLVSNSDDRLILLPAVLSCIRDTDEGGSRGSRRVDRQRLSTISQLTPGELSQTSHEGASQTTESRLPHGLERILQRVQQRDCIEDSVNNNNGEISLAASRAIDVDSCPEVTSRGQFTSPSLDGHIDGHDAEVIVINAQVPSIRKETSFTILRTPSPGIPPPSYEDNRDNNAVGIQLNEHTSPSVPTSCYETPEAVSNDTNDRNNRSLTPPPSYEDAMAGNRDTEYVPTLNTRLSASLLDEQELE